MKASRLPVVVALLPALVAGACAYVDDPDPYRPPAYYQRSEVESAALGGSLYRRDCSFCHGSEAEGTSRGPDLVTGANGPALTDFMLRTGRMPIDDPDDPTRSGEPAYTEEEIAAVVSYLEASFDQPGPHIPRVDPEEGDLSEGRDLYQEHCSACHATTGIGGAMLAEREEGGISGVHIPDLEGAGPVVVAEGVRTGPGAMPRFGRGVIDDDGLDSLVRYTEYLREPEDPGGAPIGHIGPVAEGAVGWIVGLGILLLFARWVGTRRGEET